MSNILSLMVVLLPLLHSWNFMLIPGKNYTKALTPNLQIPENVIDTPIECAINRHH